MTDMSTQSERNLRWHTLQSFPSECVSQPFVINNHEFIVASSEINGVNGGGIYKFNINKNKWIKIFDYDKTFEPHIQSSAYDNKNKLLYICDVSRRPSKMVTFDSKNKSTVTSKGIQSLYFAIVCVENKLHKICRNGDHYIYDTNEFKKINTFESFIHLQHYKLIHLKRQKCIFAFGGWNRNRGAQNSIYKFSFCDYKWNELNIKMPKKLAGFGLVSTKNEQYIIILGGATVGFSGATVGFKLSDDIFIYDTRKNTFIKSKIACPKKKGYHAIIINNSKRDEMTSFGFVNDSYKLENFVNMQLLPQYLIKIISCYYCNEELYLLGRCTGEHWKINIDYILQ